MTLWRSSRPQPRSDRIMPHSSRTPCGISKCTPSRQHHSFGAPETLLALHDTATRRPSSATTAPPPSAAFLIRHQLTEPVRGVVARTESDPALLKPSPYLIKQALNSLHGTPATCWGLGDRHHRRACCGHRGHRLREQARQARGLRRIPAGSPDRHHAPDPASTLQRGPRLKLRG